MNTHAQMTAGPRGQVTAVGDAGLYASITALPAGQQCGKGCLESSFHREAATLVWPSGRMNSTFKLPSLAYPSIRSCPVTVALARRQQAPLHNSRMAGTHIAIQATAANVRPKSIGCALTISVYPPPTQAR